MRGTFTEQWYSEANCAALGKLYERTLTVSGTVVEVGCWQGRSTCALANACHPLNVRAVDTWLGSPGEISEELAAERDVFTEFKRNVVALTLGNVWVYRMGWREYFETHREKVKFIHIDATHTFEEVRDNIATVIPLVVPGGVVCGDDAHHEPVITAAFEVLGHVAVTGTNLWYWQKAA